MQVNAGNFALAISVTITFDKWDAPMPNDYN